MAPDALPSGAPPPSAWKYTIPLGKRIHDFYPSQGDVTISTATYIPAEANGRMKVVRYGKLTVNALLTVDNPCRGLVILCDELVIGAAGSISMTGKGAQIGQANLPEFPLVDIILPDVLTIQSATKQYADFLSLVRANGICLFDRGYFEGRPGNACGFTVTQPGTGFTVVSAASCGAATGATYSPASNSTIGAGNAGSNGGTGSGAPGMAEGMSNITYGGGGGAGTPYGGGGGGGSAYNGSHAEGINYSHPTPAITTCGASPNIGGGVLIILCRGNVTIASGGIIQADGLPGTANASNSGGAGSGGGSVLLGYGGTLSNSGTIRANGGLGAAGQQHTAANGGAGSVQTKTFAQLGAAWQ